MADRDLFSRLRRLFSTNVIVRNVGGRQLKIADTQQVQAVSGKDLVDRFSRLYKSPHGMSGYNQSLYQKTMRMGLFRDYEAMDSDPLVASALDIYADETTLKSMGNEGRKNVINKFNVEKMCFSTYSEYKKLIL